MPRKKKLEFEFPPEMLAVWRNAPNLKLCPKFRRAGADKVVAHIRKDGCEECAAVFEQMAKESDLLCFLMRNKN